MLLFVTLTYVLYLTGWVSVALGQTSTVVTALTSTTNTIEGPAAETVVLPECAVSESPFICSESFF